MAIRYGQLGSDPENLEMFERERALLFRIFANTAPYTGHQFFDQLSRELGTACQVHLGCVVETLLHVNGARLVSVYETRGFIDPFEYDLTGTPWLVALEQGTTIFPSGVQKLFPTDKWLSQVGAEGFVATPLRSSSGDIIGLLSILHDAPIENAGPLAALLEGLAGRAGAEMERTQRDNALRRSELRLRQLAENSRDVLFYLQVSPAPAFSYMNPAIEQICGYPPEAFLANPEMALEVIDEEDRARVRDAIMSGSTETFSARMTTPRGERRWVEYRNFAFRDQEDRLLAISGTIRDITPRVEIMEALKLSEQYLSTLLESIPDTIVRLDGDGTLLDYVSGDVQFLAHETPDLKGRNLRDLLPATIFAPLKEVTRVALQSHRSQRTEFEVSTDSQTTSYEARCIPFREREVILILRDFTAIKWHETEDERRRLRDDLDIKAERQRINSYGLTYREITILHLIADGQADKQIAESLGISIYTVNKHVGNILGKMTAASRTEAGVRAIREGLVA